MLNLFFNLFQSFPLKRELRKTLFYKKSLKPSFKTFFMGQNKFIIPIQLLIVTLFLFLESGLCVKTLYALEIREIPSYPLQYKSIKSGQPLPKLTELLFQKEKSIGVQKFNYSAHPIEAISIQAQKLKTAPVYKANVTSRRPASLVETQFYKFDTKNQGLYSPKALVKAQQFSIQPDFKVLAQNVSVMSDEERDFYTLSGLFQNKKACDEVVPLAHSLLKRKYNRPEVYYFLGSCQHDQKLFSESVPFLAEVIEKAPAFYVYKAVEKLLNDFPPGYEKIISKSFAPKSVYLKLSPLQRSQYNYIVSKGRFQQGKIKETLALARKVSSQSPYFIDAVMLTSIVHHHLGGLGASLANLKRLDSKLGSMSSLQKGTLNLLRGRIYFEQGKYQQAIAHFDKIDNDHPSWFEALKEKGWAQIKSGLYPQAVGNMFTLQGPFFSNVYKPETYAIRTIGYINMCQFADASDTLNYLEKVYPLWSRSVKNYLKISSSRAYSTLLKYIQNPDSKMQVIDGLPVSIVKEMGRSREYIEIQKKLNGISDESSGYNRLLRGIIAKRKYLKDQKVLLKKNIAGLRSQILNSDQEKDFKKSKELEQALSKAKDGLIVTSYRLSSMDKGLVAYKKHNGNSLRRIQSLTEEFKKQINKSLIKSLAKIDVEIDQVLSNNELLRYEIYANSGKNIRYRVAGGKVKDRSAASLTEREDRYGFSFKGEHWQDEIGKFVSNIPNLCPKK